MSEPGRPVTPHAGHNYFADGVCRPRSGGLGHIDRFFEDLDLLGIECAEHYPSATEHVAEMVAMIERLLERGYAYQTEGSVYFSIEKFEQYGKLSGIDLTQVRKGERVAEDEYGKENPRDFVLWKAAKEGEPSWKSPFGDGRPGWHMECSAMSRAYLGDTFDIHCGGVDNIFPHHENEIAQSVCANGVAFVRYWLHAEHLLVDGAKMSKSLGNQYTLGDLLDRGLNLRALRYLFLSVHYRKKLNFTFDALEAAAAALDRLDRMATRLAEAGESDQVVDGCCLRLACRSLEKEFCAALADDLNVSAALGALFTFSHQLNSRVDRGITARERTESHETLAKVDRVLGVLDPARWQAKTADVFTADQPGEGNDEKIELLVERRNVARANRDFAEADRIRGELNEMGVTLEDGPSGTRWRRGGS